MSLVSDYKIWRAWKRVEKAWKEVLVKAIPSVGDKSAAKSTAIGGAVMFFGPEVWEALAKLFPPLAGFAHALGLPTTVVEGIKQLVPLVQAVGGIVMIFGLRRASGAAKATTGVVTLALLSAFLAAPAFAWPEADYGTYQAAIGMSPAAAGESPYFNIGPALRSNFGIPRGGTLAESDYSVAASAVGYYTRDHFAIMGEFGAGNENMGLLGGLRFGYVFAGWILPFASIDSRGIGEGKAAIGGGGGVAFMVPLADGSGMMLDLKAVDYGPGENGGTFISLGTTMLLTP